MLGLGFDPLFHGGLGKIIPPTWSRVQGALSTTTSVTNLAFPSTITSGSVVVGAILLTDQCVVSNITDDKGNAYTLVNSSDDTTTLSVFGFRSVGPITNGAKTLTYTYSGTVTVTWILQEEFNPGVAVAGYSSDGEQILINNSFGNSPNSFPTFQTLQPNDLLWAVNFNTSTCQTGSGWNAGQGNNTQQCSQWKQQSTANTNTQVSFGATAGNPWATAFAISNKLQSNWTLRQNQIQRTNSNSNTSTITFPKPIANGSIVVGTVAIGTGLTNNATDFVSLLDNKGNSYSVQPWMNSRASFWSNGAISNSPQTITITMGSTKTLMYFLVAEFIPPTGTSVYAVDGTPTNIQIPNGAGAPTFTSGSVTTTKSNDLLYSFIDSFGAGDLPQGGFCSINGEGQTWGDAYLIQSTPGATTSQWKSNANSTNGGINSFGLLAISAR